MAIVKTEEYDRLFDVPSTLPGSIKDQLRALAPYMIRQTPKSNGGFVMELKIPINAFLTLDINNDALVEYQMIASVTVNPPEPAFGGMIMRHADYADVQLTYK